MPQQVPGPGDGERLDPEMHALYRKCIGILLYISSERPDLQYGVKVLSSRCSEPTRTDFNLLKHVVKYLQLVASGSSSEDGKVQPRSHHVSEVARP